MDSSDEEVLLLFSLKLLSGANQKKTEKDVGARNIKKEKKNRKGIHHNLLQEIRVNDRELHYK